MKLHEARRHGRVILTLRRWRQEGQKIKVILRPIGSLRLAKDTQDLVSKTKPNKNKASISSCFVDVRIRRVLSDQSGV